MWSLGYADNLVLLAQNRVALKNMLDMLKKILENYVRSFKLSTKGNTYVFTLIDNLTKGKCQRTALTLYLYLSKTDIYRYILNVNFESFKVASGFSLHFPNKFFVLYVKGPNFN